MNRGGLVTDGQYFVWNEPDHADNGEAGKVSGTYEVTGGETNPLTLRFRPFTDGTFLLSV